MEKDFFTKPYDTALFAYAVLKRLGRGKVDTLEQRINSQKTQYLSQAFGVSPVYWFNLYLRGPYSPDLAHDLFKIKEKNIEIKTDKFIVEELESKFDNLKKFIEGKSLRDLELTATLHWLLRVAKFPLAKSKQKLVELKNTKPTEMVPVIRSVKELLKYTS